MTAGLSLSAEEGTPSDDRPRSEASMAINGAGDLSEASEPASVNEMILREVNRLYRGWKGENVKRNADLFGLNCVPPRRRVHVMIIGNHSAGKSSFVNWYMDTNCLKTGVAMETKGFTVVTHAKHRETLNGNATIECFEYLRPLQQYEGFMDTLAAELIDTSSLNKDMVTFVDTPGLADGDTRYAYPVEDVILDIADSMDLILLFLDPIGQATCSRTLRVVQKLNERYKDRIHMYLSKADMIKSTEDRHNVLFQVAQGLGSVKNNASKLPMLFLPHLTCGEVNKDVESVNGLTDVCSEINRAIELGVQDALSQVQDDTDQVLESLESSEKTSVTNARYNRSMSMRHIILAIIGILCIIYPAVVLFSFFINMMPPSAIESLRLEMLERGSLERQIMRCSYEAISSTYMVRRVHSEQPGIMYSCLALFALVALLIRFTTQRKRVLSKTQAAKLERYRLRILAVKKRRSELYAMYLNQPSSNASTPTSAMTESQQHGDR